MKHIVHVIFSLKIGGTENMLVDIANEQVKDSNVTIIIINNHIDFEVENNISPSIQVMKLNRPSNKSILLYLYQLYFAIWRIKPTIVHVHNKNCLKLFPRSIQKLLRISSFRFTIHTTGIKFGKELYNADKCYAISDAVKEDVFSRNIHVKIEVVHNGIPFNQITPKTDYNYKNTFKIIQIGRLAHDIKGQDIVINALNLVIKTFPEIKVSFHIIGNGKSDKFLKDLTMQKGVDANVHFHGSKDKSWIYSNLKEFNLLIQPSRIEGFGITIIEAMAARLPVLISDIEGPMEVIQFGTYGNYFENNNVKACSEAINSAIKNYSQITKTADVAYTYAKQKYDIKRVANIYGMKKL